MSAPTIDHIGIIVEDLERSITMFERLFHLKPSKIKNMPKVGLKIAQLNAANINIELLQYLGKEESLAKKNHGSKTGHQSSFDRGGRYHGLLERPGRQRPQGNGRLSQARESWPGGLL